MAYDLTDISKPTGTNPGAGGGIKSIIYAVLEDDLVMASFPSRGDDLVTITGDLVLSSGKYIHQIYATEKTIEPIERKLQGENRDSGGVEVSLSFFHPGLQKAIQEFKAKHMNSSFFILLKNCANDTVYLIGEPCNTVWMDEYESKWGKTIDEGKGTTFTFMSQQSLPVAIYEGALDTLLEASGSGSGA